MSLNSSQFKKIAIIAAQKADEKQAQKIVLLDLRKSQVSVSDYVLILSGNSDVHLKTLKETIEKNLKETAEIFPIHHDGNRGGQWVVLDYGGLMIHIFHEESRAFYSIERLWEDAKIVHWNDNLKPEKSNRKKKKILHKKDSF